MNKETGLDKTITFISIAILIGISAFFYCANLEDIRLLDKSFQFITNNLGFLYLIYFFIILIVLIYVAFSPIGNIKLGDGKPEHSFISWISMMFCACIGSSILYWGLIEWCYYLEGPPFGFLPFSTEAKEISIAYTMFHWGISGWASYALAAIIIAYFFFVKKIPVFRISVSCGLTSENKQTIMGRIIDVFVIVGIASGVATTIAIGTPMVAEGLKELFGIQITTVLKIGIAIAWAIMFTMSALSGIDKGVKTLSNLNLVLAIGFVIYVILVGPGSFILNNFSSSLGIMLDKYFVMSLGLDTIRNSGFPQIWTVFYWAWWLTYVPVMGLFIAKISYGRTIRELTISTLVFGSLGCWTIQNVLGGYGLYLQTHNILDVSMIRRTQGDYTAIMGILKTLPGSKVVIIIFVILAFIFLVTTCDSTAYTLASISSKELSVFQVPSKSARLLWSIAIMIWPIVLIIVGGINIVKLCSIIGSLPILFIFTRMIVYFLRQVKLDRVMSKEDKIENE